MQSQATFLDILRRIQFGGRGLWMACRKRSTDSDVWYDAAALAACRHKEGFDGVPMKPVWAEPWNAGVVVAASPAKFWGGSPVVADLLNDVGLHWSM